MQRLQGLQVAPLPKIVPKPGQGRERQQAERQAGQQAAAEAEQDERQQPQSGPVSGIRPGIEFPLHFLGFVFPGQGRGQQMADVRIV